ncbi:MATE family efflux transporter [Sphingomonas oleivorans]|uniref:MATE family efflux transporter n=2 Tax=Sphingomonas oleivorans TaxID=1735121 RepID=A0A2T5G3B5_9SPHN|nr:MATE family efflux transporter [Sphingomonas oleivorans]
MLTSLNWTLMHLIDVAIVGQFGTSELGSLAAGRTLTFITIVMGLAALSGVLVHSARADGARDARATGDYFRAGLIFALGLGIACMAVLLFWAGPLIRLAGVAPDMAEGGTAVVRAMALAYPAQFLLAAAAHFLEGVSRPRRVTVVNLAMLPLNALLAWAWVGGHLGLPALGAVGAALATATVSALGAAAMLVSAWTLPDAGPRGVRDLSAPAWRRAVADTPALIRFGTVPALASGLELAGFSWLIALSTQLGAVSAAAFQTVFSLHNLAFSMALGFGSAAGVRVGNAVGAQDYGAALPRSLIAAGLAVIGMGALSLFLFLGSDPAVRPFTNDPAVARLAAGLLALLAPFMIFDGLQLVFVYVLRSLGDQVAAGINGIFAFFLVTGGLGWWLVRAGLGAPALIVASAAGMVVAALLQGGRLWWVSWRRPRSSR